MSTVKTVMLVCDGADATGDAGVSFVRCRARFAGEASEPAELVRKRARDVGWVGRDGALDFCPAHARQGML